MNRGKTLTAKIVDMRITLPNPEQYPIGSVIRVGDADFWVESHDVPSSSLRLFPEPSERTARASEFQVPAPRSTLWRDVGVIVLIVVIVKLIF